MCVCVCEMHGAFHVMRSCRAMHLLLRAACNRWLQNSSTLAKIFLLLTRDQPSSICWDYTCDRSLPAPTNPLRDAVDQECVCFSLMGWLINSFSLSFIMCGCGGDGLCVSRSLTDMHDKPFNGVHYAKLTRLSWKDFTPSVSAFPV